MAGKFDSWTSRFAPDIADTVRRFKYASALLVLTTIVALLIINEFVDTNDFGVWPRLGAGLAFGALLAAGVALHLKTRRATTAATRYLAYLPTLIVVALFQITDTRFALPWLLPVIVILIVSLSTSFDGGKNKDGQQIAFWKSNSRAIPTAVFAVAIGLVIGLALFATSWSLEMLFSFDIAWILERWVYPVLAFLLIPLYWLSTLPRPGEDIGVLPAAGLVGQFVMIPFTLIYALILHAYAIQILIAGALPVGVVGQMVFYFMIAGLLTWILVYPGVVPQSPLVRLFRISWFGLSVVPLILFSIALWERVEAFGLTPMRVIFIGFGVWAAGATVLFLLTRGRADIRWIPGLAALVLLVLSVGPQNIENLPRWQQTLRLQALVSDAYTPEGFVWDIDSRRAASAAFDYLAFEAGERSRIDDIMRAELGGEVIPERISLEDLRTLTGLNRLLPGASGELGEIQQLNLRQEHQLSAAVDTRAYPYFYGVVAISPRTAPLEDAVLDLWIEGDEIAVARNGVEVGRVSARDWIEQQTGDTITDPLLVIESGEAAVYIQSLSYGLTLQGDEEILEIRSAYGYAFSAEPDL